MLQEQDPLREVQRLRRKLQEDHGAQAMGVTPEMPVEAELEWLTYIDAFQRQFAEGRVTTPRARLGDPDLPPLSDLAPQDVAPAVERLLEQLAEHGILVDFLGEFDAPMAYRYLTEQLLDEEIDDIRIPGAEVVFTPMTPAYEMAMWTRLFVDEVLRFRRDMSGKELELERLLDAEGNPLPAEAIRARLRAVWAHVPGSCCVDTSPQVVEVSEDEAWVTAEVWWHDGETGRSARITSTFTLRPSVYYGWDVVQTSLLTDLLEAPEAEA